MSNIQQTQAWQQIENLFDELIDLPLKQRTEVLAKAHTQYPQAVVDQVSNLLSQLDGDDQFLETGAGAAVNAAIQVLQPGDRVGQWQVVQLIGIGGQGEVYQVCRTDPDLQQTGALKISQRRHNAAGIKRFLTERQLLAELRHPGIPSLLDGGLTEDHQPYLVSEYVAGVPIDVYAQQRQLPLKQRVELLRKVCDVIAYAHQQLTVHRDIKASNVLVDQRGDVQLLDFGVAKLLSTEHSHTQAAFTLHAASPEQIGNGAITTATDVYGIGALAYHLLAGYEPFQQHEPGAVVHAVLHDEPARIDTLPDDLWAIIAKCLRKTPSDRYTSVNELIHDLERWHNQQPVLAMRGGHWYRFKKGLRRHRLLSGILVLAIAFASIYTYTITRQNQIIVEERSAALMQAQRNENLLSFFVDSIAEIHPDQGQATTTDEFLKASISRAAALEDDYAKAKLIPWLAASLQGDKLLVLDNGLIDKTLQAFDQSQLKGTGDHVIFLAGIAEMHLNADQLEQAKVYAKQAYDYAVINQSLADELFASSMLAWIMLSQDELAKADQLLSQVRATIEEHVDELNQEHDAALVYILSGRLADSPLERFEYALRAYELKQPFARGSRGMLRELVTLGVAENNLRRFQDAQQHLMEAYELAKQSTDGPPIVAWFLIQELARSFYLQSDYSTALQYLDIVDELLTHMDTSNRRAIVPARQIRAAVYLEMQLFEQAVAQLERLQLPEDQSVIDEQWTLVFRLLRAANLNITAPDSSAEKAYLQSSDAALNNWRENGCSANLQALHEAVVHFPQLDTFSIHDLEILAVLQHCDISVLPEIKAFSELRQRLPANHWRLSGFE